VSTVSLATLGLSLGQLGADTRYYPGDRCWRCGKHGRWVELCVTVHHHTHARALECVDFDRCAQRCSRRRLQEAA